MSKGWVNAQRTWLLGSTKGLCVVPCHEYKMKLCVSLTSLLAPCLLCSQSPHWPGQCLAHNRHPVPHRLLSHFPLIHSPHSCREITLKTLWFLCLHLHTHWFPTDLRIRSNLFTTVQKLFTAWSLVRFQPRLYVYPHARILGPDTQLLRMFLLSLLVYSLHLINSYYCFRDSAEKSSPSRSICWYLSS